MFGASPTSGTVPPGGSRTVTVQFGPLAAVSYGGTLTVVSDATVGTASIVVSGTGASSPPRVFNGDGRIHYGELTLNQFRVDAIRTSSIVSWLVNDVCP